MKKPKGFLMVTLLLVLLIIMPLGVILYSSTSQDYRFVQHEVERMQAEEIARSGIAYCRAYGVPPLINGKSQKLFIFPEKNYSVEIFKEVDVYRFTGTIWEGNRIHSQVSLTTPLWDLNDIRKSP